MMNRLNLTHKHQILDKLLPFLTALVNLAAAVVHLLRRIQG